MQKMFCLGAEGKVLMVKWKFWVCKMFDPRVNTHHIKQMTKADKNGNCISQSGAWRGITLFKMVEKTSYFLF